MNLMLASSAGELTHVKQGHWMAHQSHQITRARLPPGPSTKRRDQSTRRAIRLRVQYYIMPASIMKSRAESLTCETPRLVEEVNSETVRKQK